MTRLYWAIAMAVCLTALVWGAATVAAAGDSQPGGLTQKTAPAGCIQLDGDGTPCTAGRGLEGVDDVAVSRDGKYAYVSFAGNGTVSGGIAVFDRTANGALTQKPGPAGCIQADGDGVTCAPMTGSDHGAALVVSPDGDNVYLAASDSVLVFDRDTDNGTLTQKAAPGGCIAPGGDGITCLPGHDFANSADIAISPDGHNVYVASAANGAVAVFKRDANGSLSQKPDPAGCIKGGGDGITCNPGIGLNSTVGVAVSDDGQDLYATSNGSDTVTVFYRAANGSLTQRAAPDGCIAETGDGVSCTDGRGLAHPIGVDVSPDGKNAYVASFNSDAVAVFDRAADGSLAQKAGAAGCVKEGGDGVECAAGTALDKAQGVTVSPDGKQVYAAVTGSQALDVFDRAANGTLTQRAAPLGCFQDNGDGVACTAADGMSAPVGVTVSPDGKSVYGASLFSDAVTIFDRKPYPGPAGPAPKPPTPVNPAPVKPKPKCQGRTATIVAVAGRTTRGTRRRDVIVGTAGANRISAGGGNDLICSLGGNDRIAGGSGNDRIYAGSGRDSVNPGTGRDFIDAGSGNDMLGLAGQSRDRADCGSGSRDRASADPADRLRRCEIVRRVRRR